MIEFPLLSDERGDVWTLHLEVALLQLELNGVVDVLNGDHWRLRVAVLDEVVAVLVGSAVVLGFDASSSFIQNFIALRISLCLA